MIGRCKIQSKLNDFPRGKKTIRTLQNILVQNSDKYAIWAGLHYQDYPNFTVFEFLYENDD